MVPALALLAASLLAAPSETSDAVSVLTGPLLPEGSPSNAPGVVVLRDQATPLALDLQRPWVVRAILLQADGTDVYFVETSTDAASWRTLWRAPRVAGLPGQRTRTTVLSAPVTARYVRVRGAMGDGSYSVSRLRVYEALPSPWPPDLDYSIPGARLPRFPWLMPPVVAVAKDVLGALALLLLAWSAIAHRLGPTRAERWRRSLLGAVALLSALSWWNFLNFHYDNFVHHWDVYHYYVGAKYFPELGYTGLYECSAVADLDDGVEEVRGREMRDLVTNAVVPTAAILERPETCRARFSPARWDGFRHDVRFFRTVLGPSQWAGSQTDHGFNATPVWILAGSALANLGPASAAQVERLASLDVGLLLALWALVAWSFGFEALCAAVVYWSLNSLSRFAWTGGAFLRYDWLFWTVASVCLLRRRRPALAGFAMAYASLLRIFPACLFAGLVLKALWEAVAQRRFEPVAGLRRVALGAVAALVLLVPASVTLTGRPGAWREFDDNTRRFLTTEAHNFIGLRVVASYRPSMREELAWDPLKADPFADWEASQAEVQRQARPGLLVASLAFAALVAAAARHREDWVAAILGMGLAPIALKLGHYYYSWPLLYGLLWSVCPPAGLGVVAVAWISNGVATAFPQYDERAVWLSLVVVVFVTLVTSLLAREPRESGPGASVAEPIP
jgi:hypothetical protein